MLGGPQHPQVSAAAAVAECTVRTRHPRVLSSLHATGDPGPCPGPPAEEGRAFECLRATGCARPSTGRGGPSPQERGDSGVATRGCSQPQPRAGRRGKAESVPPPRGEEGSVGLWGHRRGAVEGGIGSLSGGDTGALCHPALPAECLRDMVGARSSTKRSAPPLLAGQLWWWGSPSPLPSLPQDGGETPQPTQAGPSGGGQSRPGSQLRADAQQDA